MASSGFPRGAAFTSSYPCLNGYLGELVEELIAEGLIKRVSDEYMVLVKPEEVFALELEATDIGDVRK